ncbi:MAG: 8-amino-7-oxononanoate synthase [Terrimicrobiaceae bacterium]
MDLDQFLRGALGRIEAGGLLRSLRVIDSAQGAKVVCEGRRLLNFSSNDYLGLAAHPRLIEAARQAVAEAGAGAGASRLISGTHRYHEQLEEELARFKNTASALTFSSGYAAALGVIPALAANGDVVILDKLCHACLIDAARLSGAVLRVFPHNHLGKLESHLRWAREKHPQARILVVVESVYSMDGDLAPLHEIVELKDRFGAWLFVDEAHALGVLGHHGRGLADEHDVPDRVEVQMGTLGKALGAGGAYVCGSAALRDYLINSARSFIFSTAPPPGVAAAACAAVSLLASAEGADLVQRLSGLRETLTDLVGCAPSPSAIVPVLIGNEGRAMEVSRRLWDAGFFVPAIRYPTVAKGAARLRITVTAGHTEQDLRSLASTLERSLTEE